MIEQNEDWDPHARRGYLPGLDGLRALSVSIVLFGHFFLRGGYSGFAALGVYIFFTISGFLITRLLIAEYRESGRVDLPAFYGRRLLRLYPVLVAFMTLTVGISAVTNRPVPGIEIASVFGYFTNYLLAWREYHNSTFALPIGVLWSLSVEEHFYAIMPAFLLLFAGRSRPLIYFCAATFFIPFTLRFIYLATHPELLGTNVIYRLSETRFDSIAVGVLLAALCESKRRREIIKMLSSGRVLAFGIALIVASYVIRDPVFKDTLRYTLRSVGSVPIVASAVFGRRGTLMDAALNWPAAVWLGRLSYSLYVWHGGTRYFAECVGLHVAEGWSGATLLTAISVALACASYYAIERPALRLRSSFALWFGGRPRRAAATSA